MSTLKQKAQSILTEKDTKIKPANIKKDVQIFGITGTYTGSGKDNSLIPASFICPEVLTLYSGAQATEIYSGMYWYCGQDYDYEDEIKVRTSSGAFIWKNIPIEMFVNDEESPDSVIGYFQIKYDISSSGAVGDQEIYYYGSGLEFNTVYSATLRAYSPYGGIAQQGINIKILQEDL